MGSPWWAGSRSRNIATNSSMRRDQRSPPGSLESCWSTRPVVHAVHMSRWRGSVTPLRASCWRAEPSALTAGANASGGGLEVRDRALEQQLVTGHVAAAEVDEATHAVRQHVARVVRVVGLVHRLRELGRGSPEHRVVDGVLRLEVAVDGRRGDPRLLGEIANRQRGQASVAHDRPSGLQDGVTGGPPPRLPPLPGHLGLRH